MQQTVPIKHRGFTLIELLLVLALVVALTVAGIAAYQIQLRNFNVDKTALQMQQWLQAGLAFRADCGQWPPISQAYTDDTIQKMTGLEALGSTCPPYSADKRAYMSDGSVFGPWPFTFSGVLPINNYYEIGPLDGDTKNSPNFYVQTYLQPVTAKDQTMVNIAKMIAGRLPNASVDIMGNMVRVRAYVGKGGSGSTPSVGGGQIIDMEMVNSSQQAKHIKMPDQSMCPPGTKAVLVSAMSGIDAGQVGQDRKKTMFAVMGSSLDQTNIDENGFISAIPHDNKTKIIQPSLKTERDKTIGGQSIFMNDGRNQVLMISACLPSATVPWTPIKPGPPSSSGVRY